MSAFINTSNHLFLRSATPPNTFTFNPHVPLSPQRRNYPAPTCNLSLTPAQQTTLTVAGALSTPLVAWSEFTLVSTGCGLPPGPYGAIGAAEGIAYLVVGAIVALSVYSKVSTGGGLPEGPAKLLGAVEGVSFLLAVCGIAAAGYVTWVYGEVPNAVPVEGSRCFPPSGGE